MKLKLVKASQGLVWVRQGILACRKQPLGFIGLLGLFGCVALLLVGLPARIGSMVIVGFMPAVWMGFMLATRRVLSQQRITLSVMFEALKGPQAPRREFALLGAVYVLATVFLLQVSQWLGPDPDAIDKVMANTQDAAELLTNPLIQEDMLWRVLLTIPVSLVFWHTPALLLWARVPVAKALFFSAVATWRNIGAFIVYGMGWIGILLILALVDRALLAIIEQPMVGNVIAIMASMWVVCAFYASLYFTVVDCFEAQADQAVSRATPGSGQA